MRRLIVLCTVVLGAALLVPAAGHARIVLNKSVGQVRLGASDVKLRDKLATPDRNIRTTGIISGLPMDIWEYKGLEIEFEGGNTVTTIRTTRIFERTKKGAGVGTPKRLLRKLHPRLRCGKGKWTSCTAGRTTRRVSKGTTFELQNGRVVSISMWRFVLQPDADRS